VVSALVIVVVLGASITLDITQVRRAEGAVERLRAMVRVSARVVRAGQERDIPSSEVAEGDIVRLAAGDLVPADGVLLAARDLFINQAALTGEAFPIEKRAREAGSDADSAAEAQGALVAGSHVVSGSGTLLVCRTGPRTQFAAIARLVATRAKPNPLERGAHRFGVMLLRLTLFLVLFVVLVNAWFHRPVLESFMFAVALAVGLTPELLPMIIAVTLARGAIRLAREQAIVKQPGAVYALGAMDVFATDKTGTLTEGRIRLERHLDAQGAESAQVLLLACVNSRFESGLRNPLDEAILAHEHVGLEGWRKLDEVPFDFERRRVSVLVDAPDGRRLLIVKGAPEDLLPHCDRWQAGSDARVLPMDDAMRAQAARRFESLGEEGMRALAICWREMDPAHPTATAGDEDRLVLAGFAAFLDPPREDTRDSLRQLDALGLEVKILTGDNERVAQHLCRELGIEVKGVLLGHDAARLDLVGLGAAALEATLFCRVTPAQKARIIAALQARGRVVGFLGDGINDAPALRGADVGISVDSAVDVAKDAADVILQGRHLSVLVGGVQEGRRSHANVMKYLRMGTSSNFGNMVSMAGATLFLPFLPLLPIQVLLNNLLYDLSEVALPFDRVEADDVRRPQQWDLEAIRRFMLVFGPLSSMFDFVTFGVLIWVFEAGPELFRTGWFIESIASQVLVIFAVRTRLPMFAARPHPALAAAAFGVLAVALAIPFTAMAPWLGFVAPSGVLLATLAGLVLAYLAAVEVAKARWR
jgi:Mg2+-importing ATPase